MPKRMLIDASHPEETRVVVLDGQKVEEFDFEAASKRPLKGNIYLAKVTRVEPSLQAAFVEYGGNRQGFLAFSEIHPDYYQIPVADRLALLAEQEAEARRRVDDEFESFETARPGTTGASAETDTGSDDDGADEDAENGEESTDDEVLSADDEVDEESPDTENDASMAAATLVGPEPVSLAEPIAVSDHDAVFADPPASYDRDDTSESEHFAPQDDETLTIADAGESDESLSAGEPRGSVPDEQEHVGGSEHADAQRSQPLVQRPPQRWVRRRHYKIQEVIKRRQIILVQVVKEERGNKGAALTTYLSLAGRYCVLMPNTPRGGGISRKITNANDRKRLKSAAQSLELPEGMGLIIRTAGENRTKLEIKRDYEYLLRMWDTIREITLKSNAPACVYEEGDLIKRAIRDLYNKDVSEIIVEGEDGYRNAKDFMRMLMPSHAKNVKQYKEPLPLFQRMHIEAQLDAMFSPTVTLRSGGYVVINQTEALVAIDVNSGRATREHSIEDTAYKTNLEAAEEIARQLRLRDLAGLIVIDFIDMEDPRNDRNVEKRLRDCVKNDRARVQIGKISQFGLLEMSRQRLRAGVVAGSTVICPTCSGQGIVRSVESTALRVLRAVDEEGQRQRVHAIIVHVPVEVAMYTLNQKRRELARMEQDYGLTITLQAKDDIPAGTFELERVGQRAPEERERLPQADEAPSFAPDSQDDEVEDAETAAEETAAQPANGQSQGEGRRRRRRRRRGRDRGNQPEAPVAQTASPERVDEAIAEDDDENGEGDEAETSGEQAAAQPVGGNAGENGGRRRRRRRRRGRRGPREGGYEGGSPYETRAVDDQASEEASRAAEVTYEAPSLFEVPETVGPVAEAPPEPGAALNAPSAPVWTLYATEAEHVSAAIETDEPVPSEPSLPLAAGVPADSQDQDNVPISAAPSAPAQPLPIPAPGAPAEPTRKGWWQRPFRARD